MFTQTLLHKNKLWLYQSILSVHDRCFIRLYASVGVCISQEINTILPIVLCGVDKCVNKRDNYKRYITEHNF